MRRFLETLLLLLFLNMRLFSQISYTVSDGNEYGMVLEYSPSGKILLSGAKNKIGFWTTNTNLLSKSTAVHSVRDINDLAFWNDDTVCISNDKEEILLYDLLNNNTYGILKGHHRKVTSIDINAASGMLFSGSLDKTTILWDLTRQTIKKQFKDHKDFVLATAIDKTTEKFASCGADGIINVYDKSGNRIFNQQLSDQWLWSLAFNDEGKSLAVGGEGKIYILTGLNEISPVIKTLEGIKGKVLCLDFSPDGKYLAVGTADQYIYVFNWRNQDPLVDKRIYKGVVTDIEFDPDGKTMLTTHDNLKGLLKWDVRSLNILPSKYVKNQDDKIPPQIYISNPPRISEDRVVVYSEMIKLQGTVIDESGVNKVMVNGVNTPLSDNGSFTINIPLSYSETPVRIEAFDVNNNVSLKRFTIIRKDISGSDYIPEKARNFLLVIGINKYQNYPPLTNAVKDANDIAGTLSGLYNFTFSDITMLIDSQATRNNIYHTLRGFAEKVSPKDNFIIYFSGHGYFDPVLNEGYWLPVDAERSMGNFLSNSDVLKIIRSINSQHTLLIADACFAGSLFNESARGFVENVEKFRSRWGFASGRLEEVSDGEIGKNSPFATAILNFLRTTPKDDLAVSELIQSVKMKVPENNKQTPIGNPLKNVGDEGGEFIFHKRH